MPVGGEQNNIAAYVMDIRTKMKEMSDLVKDNLEKAQQKQKEWYDQKARDIEYQEGEQVLPLLPDNTHKFQRQWRGPYRVLKRLGKVSYEIDVRERGTTKVIHSNLLKRCHTCEQEEVCYVNIVEENEDLVEYRWSKTHQSLENNYLKKNGELFINYYSSFQPSL